MSHTNAVAWFWYYGWVNVLIAAVAMAATYPGRTHGLGMITEPLLRELTLDRVSYSALNLWATLLGALFCFGVGRWVDRFGCRLVLTVNLALLGFVVVAMSFVWEMWTLFAALVLTRGLGQSALSIVSLTLVAKWFPGARLAFASAVFAVLTTPLFALLIKSMQLALTRFHVDWRVAWATIGLVLALGLAPLAWLFARDRPEADAPSTDASDGMEGATLWQALATPAFWVFALTISFWGMVSSGVALFNEAIFKERGLSRDAYFDALTIAAAVTVASKLLSGWLASRWRITRLLAVSLVLMAVALFSLPLIREDWQAYVYAVCMGTSSGVVALVFFAVWGQLYGRREIGRIQGIAQMMTVLASAFGPLVIAAGERLAQSYSPVFQTLAPLALVLAMVAWVVPLPRFAEVPMKGDENGTDTPDENERSLSSVAERQRPGGVDRVLQDAVRHRAGKDSV